MEKRSKSDDQRYTVVEIGNSVFFGKKLDAEEQSNPIAAWRADGSSLIVLGEEDEEGRLWACILQTNTRPSIKARAKGLGAFDGDKLREEVRQLRDLLTPRQPQTRLDAAQIQKRLKCILAEPYSFSAERLIAEFVRDLRAARRLAFSDQDKIHPFTKKLVATSSGPHTKFISAVCRLTKQKKKPPTKGELAKELGFTSSHVSKLCSQHRLSWLPDEPRPGRRGSSN